MDAERPFQPPRRPAGTMTNSSAAVACLDQGLDGNTYIYISIGAVSFLLLVLLMGLLCLLKYRSLVRTIRELRSSEPTGSAPPKEAPRPPRPTLAVEEVAEGEQERAPLQRTGPNASSSKKLWKGLQQGPRFIKSDLNLMQLIKAGKEGVFYQARMTRGTCKGHGMFTCKLSKEGVRQKHVETEVSIMRKLVHHKNILQLLDWNTSEGETNTSVSFCCSPVKTPPPVCVEPYILIMEYVSYGTLRTFLQTHRSHLSMDPELQSLLTIASYHIALAMQHLRSKMIVHCDLALRNIMVNKFPWEVKVAEFGLARDLTRMASRRSSRWWNHRQRVPLRWYPPEYFKNHYYGFKGDVWAFGIVLWEMQSFGTLPYPNLETSEAVIYHISIGHKNTNPEGCRPEILHMMRNCWLEPYSLRPSFTDVVLMLENIMENDAVRNTQLTSLFRDRFLINLQKVPCSWFNKQLRCLVLQELEVLQ
ncbi:fibroblast growth factor receptor 4 isoform X1 [Takifugu rubripes]|uniref:fibroblast growth factor receptor 4 isoform X1 n=3 Tax=Takifugu rubripes TaxID=31033 RepID=UPI0011453713|nr:fibroblast growth factor receptor 4-like isoform X1 [Takifugu rubripes]